MAAPIITLTTDFGTQDGYAGAMKGVILGICPAARVIDLTHDIAPQDVTGAAVALENAVPLFPAGAIHVAVVDPGVGSTRRAIALASPGWTLVGPDNGLFGGLWREAQSTWGPDRLTAVELTEAAYHRPRASSTFHGRDVFAPVAAHLAGGVTLATLGRPIADLVALSQAPLETAADGALVGRVVHVDRFGNCLTDIAAERIESLGTPAGLRVHCADLELGPPRSTYADVAPGEVLALIGSCGRLELALRNGSLAEARGIEVGATVRIGPDVG